MASTECPSELIELIEAMSFEEKLGAITHIVKNIHETGIPITGTAPPDQVIRTQFIEALNNVSPSSQTFADFIRPINDADGRREGSHSRFPLVAPLDQDKRRTEVEDRLFVSISHLHRGFKSVKDRVRRGAGTEEVKTLQALVYEATVGDVSAPGITCSGRTKLQRPTFVFQLGILFFYLPLEDPKDEPDLESLPWSVVVDVLHKDKPVWLVHDHSLTTPFDDMDEIIGRWARQFKGSHPSLYPYHDIFDPCDDIFKRSDDVFNPANVAKSDTSRNKRGGVKKGDMALLLRRFEDWESAKWDTMRDNLRQTKHEAQPAYRVCFREDFEKAWRSDKASSNTSALKD